MELRQEAPKWQGSISTSCFYQAFGIRGYQYARTDYRCGQTIYTIDQASRLAVARPAAPARSGHTSFPDTARREPSNNRRPADPMRRMLVREKVSQVEVDFADPWRSYTHSLERSALELSRHMNILEVAMHSNFSWDVIKDIQKRDFLRRFAKPKLKDLRQIAIDEIAVVQGHPPTWRWS